MLRHAQFAQVDRDISIFFTFANLTCSQAVRNGNGPCPWWKHWPAFSHQLYTPHLSQNIDYRRRFRSLTSDNTDRWNSRGGKSQRREEKKKEDDRRERVRRQKMQVREKVEKSRNTVFFQCFVAPENRKVGSLKRRVRSHVARWEMKSCTPLRRAHFQKSKCTKHTNVGALLEVEISKKRTLATLLWHEADLQVKMHKARRPRSTFGSWDVQKAYAVVARSTFPSQNVKSTTCSDHFWGFRCGFAWLAQLILHLAKSEQNVRVL